MWLVSLDSIAPVILENSVGWCCSRVLTKNWSPPSSIHKTLLQFCFVLWRLYFSTQWFDQCQESRQVRHCSLCPSSSVTLVLIHFLSLHHRATVTVTQPRSSTSVIRLLSHSRFHADWSPPWIPLFGGEFHKWEACLIQQCRRKLARCPFISKPCQYFALFFYRNLAAHSWSCYDCAVITD